MASSNIFFIIAVFAFFAISSCLATEFTVGDDKGWNLDFDQGWATGKEFHVGDTLVFKYKGGVHNVIGVSGTEFQQCEAAATNNNVRATGNDVTTLLTPGRKWYICGKAGHCANRNMKLNITVLAQVDGSPATSPTSPSAATPNAAFSFYGIWTALMAAFVGFLFV